ncbi:MAG: LysR family transcriptional regulator [Polyangiales bacterium]
MRTFVETSDYRLLSYFVVIANEGGVRGAARALELSPSAVSRALSTLEELVGARLADRNTSSFVLTAAGHRLYRHAATMEQSAAQALSAAQTSSEIEGRVSINLPTELAIYWLAPVLRRFRLRHPRVDVEITADDALCEDPEAFDLLVRGQFTLERPPGMFFELLLVTTMEWDTRAGESIEEFLARVPFVGTAKQLAPMTLPADRGDKEVRFDIRRGTIVNSHTSALELVRRGLGVALCMDLAVERDLQARRLTRVWGDVGFGFVSVTPSAPRQSASPALEALWHFLFPET